MNTKEQAVARGCFTVSTEGGSACTWLNNERWYFRVWHNGAADVCAVGSEGDLTDAITAVNNCLAAMKRGEL